MDIDLAAISPGEGYRLLTSIIVPRPVAWVTTIGEDGTINAAPFSFFNMLGSDPPIVAIGVGNRPEGTPKDTARNAEARGELPEHAGVPRRSGRESRPRAGSDPDAKVQIDLPNQTLTTPGGRTVQFPVDEFSKHCLVNGVDELGYIQQQEASIAAFEAKRVGSINVLA